MAPKPAPKKSADPTAAPAAVPPHTREQTAGEHPYGPAAPAAPEQPELPSEPAPRARPDGPPPGGADRRPDARTSGRPRGRARGSTPDLEDWSRQVGNAALKVGAARRKLAARQDELADVLARARKAGVDEGVLSAWLVSAGLDPGETDPR